MSSGELYDEKELFLRIAGGDEQAFTDLFRLYAPKLLPFLTKLTRNEHLAKEMFQETFLRLWVNRSDLAKVNHPAAWIYRIASNLSITYLRTQSNRARLLQKMEIVEAGELINEEIDSKELQLIIRRAVNLLPEKRQEVYRLSREEGLLHNEIAKKLNISVNTVKNQIGLSLRFIQEFINKETGLSIVTLVALLTL